MGSGVSHFNCSFTVEELDKVTLALTLSEHRFPAPSSKLFQTDLVTNATEGALFISAQLSTDAVSAL